MQQTFINVLKLTSSDGRIMHIENPSEETLALINNQTIIDNFNDIIWDFNNQRIYKSSDVLGNLSRILKIIEDWWWRKYRVNKTTFHHYCANTWRDFNLQGNNWYESVSKNEYEEFIKVVSYEQMINRMVNSMPSSNTPTLEVQKFVDYFIHTNPTKILSLTDNWNHTITSITDLICRCKSIKNGLRERTRWWYLNLHSFQTSWN